MNRGDVVRTLLVGGLMALGGYLAGRNLADDTVRRERDVAVAEVERLREAAPTPVPATAAAPGAPLAAPPVREAGAGAAPAAKVTPATVPESTQPGERPETLDLKDVASADELTKRLLAFATSRLAEGPKGHLELLRAIDASIVKDERLGRLMNDEREAVRVIYPMLKFAVYHEGQVTGFVETVFKTMAETPSDLEGIDDDTLEFITEGLGMVVPSVITEEQLETLRGYVTRTLQASPESLPQGLRSNLGELKRLLEAWAPPLPVEEIVAKLADLPADANARREVLRLARRLGPEDWAKVDVAAVLGPAIASGDWQALMLLSTAAPSGAALASLDARVTQSGARLDGGVAGQYLHATQRGSWSLGRGFLEAWLAAGGGQSGSFAQAVLGLRPRPTPDELRDLAGRSDVSESNRKSLLAAAGR